MLELAFEVRKMAVKSIRADALDVRLTLDALSREVRLEGKHHAAHPESVGYGGAEAAHSCSPVHCKRISRKKD